MLSVNLRSRFLQLTIYGLVALPYTANAQITVPVDCDAKVQQRAQITAQYDSLIDKMTEEEAEIERHAQLGGLLGGTRSGSSGESFGNAADDVANSRLAIQRSVGTLREQKSEELRRIDSRPCENYSRLWYDCQSLDSKAVSYESRIDACSRLVNSKTLHGPDLAKVLSRRADAYASLLQSDLAFIDCDQAIAVAPAIVEPYVVRGSVHFSKAEFEAANRDFELALQMNPHQSRVLMKMGWSYLLVGNRRAAIEAFGQAIGEEKNLAAAYSGRATAYSGMRDFDHAVADYDEAIALAADPDALDGACWARAVSNRELAKALEQCNESLRLRPGDANVIGSRALVYLRMGKIAEALADCASSENVPPQNAETLYLCGIAKRKGRQVKEGNAEIARAAKIDPQIEGKFSALGLKP